MRLFGIVMESRLESEPSRKTMDQGSPKNYNILYLTVLFIHSEIYLSLFFCKEEVILEVIVVKQIQLGKN